jgi:hypothetical protein
MNAGTSVAATFLVATRTTLSTGTNPTTHGQAVTFTAQVSTANNVGPSGAITFRDGATALCTAVTMTFPASCAGHCSQAQCTTSTLAPGVHSITAEYLGSSTAGGSTSTELSHTVELAPRLANISTRMRVLSGDDVMIAGFIIGGPSAKRVVVNVAGPSLANYGVTNPVANPKLTLVRSGPPATVLAANDDWQTQDPADVAAILASGFQPNHALEPALIATLGPGAYTAIVEGTGGQTGVGLIGIFEVDHPEVPLINISTRGKVLTGDDVMIAGFIIQGAASKTVVVNVAGPSLVNAGVPNPLPNPQITIVRSSDNAIIASNDNWQTQANPSDVAAITNAGFQPNHPAEPAVILTLPPGAYTAIVSGVGGGTGVGLVGVFAVQ